MTPYRIIDHTADLRVSITGRTVEELFGNAAATLVDLIFDRAASRAASRLLTLTVAGNDWADLMVDWLRELLYLWNGKELVVATVLIEELTPNKLRATVGVVPYEPERDAVKTEIKAVTYHQIRVSERLTGWEATIIFDV